MSEDLDPVLMAKVLTSVRLEVVLPMKIKVTKFIQHKETDSHVFEFSLGASIAEIQKEVTSIVNRWKGGFGPGTSFLLERVE